MEPKFKVGDRVVNEDYDGKGKIRIVVSSIVVKVYAKKVVLENGHEWCSNGLRPWGLSKESFYRGGLLRLRTKEDDSTIRRQNCLHRIGRVDWDLLSNDVLAAVDSLIKQAQTTKEKSHEQTTA